MQDIATAFVNNATQCWACPVFDALFAIISNSAAVVYQRLSFFSVILFVTLFAFYVLNAVWQNIKRGGDDPMYTKTLQRVGIKSMFALSLLAAGIIVPQFISKITFEPTAILTLKFSEAMLPTDYVVNNAYTAIPLSANGFFNIELRDTILQLIQTSVTNFQVFINIGIGIIDKAFDMSLLDLIGGGISGLIRHFIVAIIGIFLTYNFGKLFIKYSFCFMDIIFSMAIFAFFFPLSIVFFIFQGAQDVPGWMSNLGKGFGGEQIKKIINAIVSVAATIFTYTIITIIIRGYLDGNGIDSYQIDSTSLFNFDLDNSDAMQLTIVGATVLLYIINYIADQPKKITQKIMKIFGLSMEDSMSKEMGDNALKLTNLAYQNTKNIVKAIVNPESVTKESDSKDKGDKKDDKK